MVFGIIPECRSAALRKKRSASPESPRLHREFVFLAVILDAFSRKVVGRGLDRTLAARLPMAALEQAIADRKPRPGVVHHSDRGVQYASGVYIAMLRKHDMIPSMSRPANPYDNASCESFMKTLKREEIYANQYRDLDHLREHIAAFIHRYYNRGRLPEPRSRKASARVRRRSRMTSTLFTLKPVRLGSAFPNWRQ
jgi:transposase InsO family protein